MEDEDLDPAPIWDNLESFEGRAWHGSVDIITAGFPCQPFSVAGSRKGTADSRWIWSSIERIIRDVGPRLVFLENVPGLVQHGMPTILGTLADLGYDAVWDLFKASDVGAPHRRSRWFLLGQERILDASSKLERNVADAASDHRWRGERGPEAGAGAGGQRRRGSAERGGAMADGGSPRREGQQPDGPAARPARRSGRAEVADADGDGGQRQQERAGIEGARAGQPNGHGPDWRFPWPPGPGESERWATVEAEAQPAIRGMADGIPSRVDRLRMLGNAAVPDQAALAFRTLWKGLNP